jgi:hypothetical protein
VCQLTTIKYLDQCCRSARSSNRSPAATARGTRLIRGHHVNGQSVNGLPKMLIAGYRRAGSDVCHLSAGCACFDRSFTGVIGWTHQDSKPNNVLLISTTGTIGQGAHFEEENADSFSLIAIQVVPATAARLGQWP